MPLAPLPIGPQGLRALSAAIGLLISSLVQAENLTIAAYPAVDSIAKSAAAEWKKKHPGVELKIVSRSFPDHHTAMTTALSTSSNLPDVMVLEVGYVCLLYTSPSPRDGLLSRMPSSA